MEKKRYAQGLFFAGLSFVIWGLLPLYWKLASDINPFFLISNRVVWCFVFVVIILVYRKSLAGFFRKARSFKTWLYVIVPALLMAVNWIVYIWAVLNDYLVEASLGYFMNPLVLTILGRVFLKEKLTRFQFAGIVIAAIGVIIKTAMYGKLPLISLALGATFAVYGFLKKKSPFSSIDGLGFETLILGVPALGYILFAEFGGGGISGNVPLYYWLLMAGGGLLTAVPLLLYAEGTKRLPLAAVGFLQYIAPILMLVLGVFAFGEPFRAVDIIPFVFIWIGLMFFSRSQYKLLSGRGGDIEKADKSEGKTMIRKARTQDLDGIMQIVAETIVIMGEVRNYQWDSTYPLRSDFEADIEKQQLYILDNDDGKIGGLICANFDEPEEYGDLEWKHDKKATVLHRMVVNPYCRGRGIAQKLMEFGEEIAKQNNTYYIKSDTYSTNKIMNALFAKRGFEPVGEIHFQGRELPYYCYEKVLS